VTTARCPACGASTVDGAPWCTLCYADLRPPAPSPAVEPVAQLSATPVTAAQLPVSSVASETSAAPATPAQTTGVDLLDPSLDAPVSVAADVPRGPATWPCSACGAAVALEHDSCPECATPFLAGAQPDLQLDLPLLGALRPLTATKASRTWLMVGGTLVLTAVLMLALTIVGLLL
jgi:hypothetical protein